MRSTDNRYIAGGGVYLLRVELEVAKGKFRRRERALLGRAFNLRAPDVDIGFARVCGRLLGVLYSGSTRIYTAQIYL